MQTKMKGTMKSIFRIFSALLLPLLLWTGCEIEPVSPEMGIPDHCIEITLGGLHPALTTKASSRGDDAYNENLVKSVDCFFYPNGASSSDAAFMALGRGAEPVAEGDSTIYKVKVFFTDADANVRTVRTISLISAQISPSQQGRRFRRTGFLSRLRLMAQPCQRPP